MPNFSQLDARDSRLASSRSHILITAHHWYHDVIGGSFRLATEFAEWMSERGHRVSYVCCEPVNQTGLPSREKVGEIDLFRYPYPHGSPRWKRFHLLIQRAGECIAKIQRETPIDFINGHSPLQFYAAMKSMKAEKFFANYTVHSPFDDELASHRNRLFGRLIAPLQGHLARRIERYNVDNADRVQADSQYTLEVLKTKYPAQIRDKGVVAPGWVNLDRFQPVENRKMLRATLGTPWETNETIFLCVRRLEPRMGIDTLIRAAERLASQQKSFRVIIGGAGSSQVDLQRLASELNISDRVYFLGRIPEPMLASCYAAADCFVLPTRALECFGLIVLEAFASGTPVIGSRVAAIPELVSQQGNEWLFAPNDVAGLVSRLQSFLDGILRTDPVVLKRIATKYAREIILPQWESLAMQPGDRYVSY